MPQHADKERGISLHLVQSSLDGDAAVRIGWQDDNIALRWVSRWFRLTPADWARLQEALIAASFWALDPDEGPLARGLDGAFWTIEGRRKDIFRAISRWSPHDETVYDLGRLFMEFAGPPLARIEIY